MSKNNNAGGVTKLSRSKVDLYISCRKCFYLDQRLKISAPPGFPFSLNNAVDELLKREFDSYRKRGEPHPYMVQAGINAIPAKHPKIDEWRRQRMGVRVQHPATGLELYGLIDDLWQDTRTGNYIAVDYKATSKKTEVSLDAEWQDGYKRQMEFYQWLLRGNGLTVDDTGYLVYCNGIKNSPAFGDTLRFKTTVIPYVGSDAWIEPTLAEIKETLEGDELPAAAKECKNCTYVEKVQAVTQRAR
jgi:CRISPR/Cas system-associated exonuclease Cas4 (RecB family)